MWMRVEDGHVAELTDTDPAGRYHPDLAWVSVAGVTPAPQPGWTATLSNGTWSLAAPPDRSAEMARAALVASATAAVVRSDVTLLRCVEHAVAIPAEWVAFRAALREIIAGTSTATELPARPSYPAGT